MSRVIHDIQSVVERARRFLGGDGGNSGGGRLSKQAVLVRGGEQPMTAEQLAPFIEELQRMDRLIDIRWEPQARMIKAPEYSPLGKLTAGEYEGRWQVIRYDTDNLHPERRHNGRPYTVLLTVNTFDYSGRIPMVEAEGGYHPIDENVVRYMRTWDRANTAFMNAMDALWREDELREQAGESEMNAAAQEGAEKVYSDHVGEWAFGRGFGEATEPARKPQDEGESTQTPKIEIVSR